MHYTNEIYSDIKITVIAYHNVRIEVVIILKVQYQHGTCLRLSQSCPEKPWRHKQTYLP